MAQATDKPVDPVPPVLGQQGPGGSHLNLEDLRASRAAVVTIAQVATLLDIDARTVSRAVHSGELPALRLGRRLLIPRIPLLAYLGVSEEPAQSDVGSD